MEMKIHHIGIITRNIEKSRAVYEALGYKALSDTAEDNIQHNKIAFMQSGDGSQTIELIEPMGESSSVAGFGDGYHHICYEAENAESFEEEFKKLKIGRIFTKPIEAPALQNRKVLFAYLTNGVFVEFLM